MLKNNYAMIIICFYLLAVGLSGCVENWLIKRSNLKKTTDSSAIFLDNNLRSGNTGQRQKTVLL